MTVVSPTTGAGRIANERTRQIQGEGYEPEDDLQYTAGELVVAAQGYIWANERLSTDIPLQIARLRGVLGEVRGGGVSGEARKAILALITDMEGLPLDHVGLPENWPWSAAAFKPSIDPLRNLEKAGALLAAEIDRVTLAQSTVADV